MSQAGSGPLRPGNRLLLRGVKQLITLQGPARIRRGAELREIGLLRDASVLAEGGTIREVGSARRIENLRDCSGVRFVDARGMVAIPAFVDSVGDLLPLSDKGLAEGSPFDGSSSENASDYPYAAMNTVSKRLEQALRRLAQLGTLYAQFRLRFPEQGVLRSRLLRNLLQMDLPLSSFRAILQASGIGGEPEVGAFHESLPRVARGFWRELQSSISVAVPCSALRGMPRQTRNQILHAIRTSGSTGLVLSRPGLLAPAEVLELSVSHSATVWGTLPSDTAMRAAFARFGVPWIATGNSYIFDDQSAFHHVRDCIREGLSFALSSGFDVNAPGSASLLDLISIFRQRGGLRLEELLHLAIANNAFAAGAGHRMGTIEAGKEANILLLDCPDYREIGLHLGLPRLAAIIWRGELLHCDAGLQG